jgi:hypothetical protein
MARHRVACLDVWSEAVREVVARTAPPEFELVFVSSYDAGHQRGLAATGATT